MVVGGCGASEDEEEQSDNVKPGADDKVFRLDKKPIAECRALEDSRKPAWAALGAPLRERLNRDEAVCFARSYDAAHLAKHPQQIGPPHRGAEGERREARRGRFPVL